MYYIGIDLGTSAMKLLMMNEAGDIKNVVSEEYPVSFPHPGWSEQNPEDWYKALLTGIPKLIQDVPAEEIAGISFGGQMHGLVILDADDEVIRPAILWNDGRTTKETDFLNNEIGKEVLSERTANIAFAGFTAPKILWVKNHEPENFKRIAKIMLPKDYLAYKLSGVHATDTSDASGMLLLDVAHRCWSKEMIALLGIREDMLPKVFESYDKIGTLIPDVAARLHLLPETVIAAGAGDNAAAAIGTGVVKGSATGKCNISLGTSGTIFISSENFTVDQKNALHSFCHADGSWHLMGCILSAASCNKWWMEDILKSSDFAGEQAGITEDRLGENHVFYLPYLMGERSPLNDALARSCFIGMTMDTSRQDLTQAVFEGVAFALRDCYEVARSQGIELDSTMICGGGAKSPLWRKIVANVLNLTVNVPANEQGPGMGGAMLAMVACGAYPSVKDAAKAIVKITKTEVPDPVLVQKYEKRYQQFRTLYPSLKDFFKNLSEENG